MRAGQNEATGSSGESEVLAEFERLGWAGVIDSRHDVGTDLYLRPRDNRRFELGAVMGAQVKTGPSYFRSHSPAETGTAEGWWFKDANREHIDYWLNHALPHVLILRDQTTNVSYWVHVTPDAVVPTGKGAKILVPKRQTVGATHHQVLADIALSQRPMPLWDGSAWDGATNLSVSDELRYALIAPRLIAPHPNLSPASISGVEALAMQMLIRDELDKTFGSGELAAVARDGRWGGLSLEAARQSDDWAWRATAALRQWLYEGDITELLNLSSCAQASNERAASAVLQYVAHLDNGEADSALAAINVALETDDYSPADYAWLQAQRARALLEIGEQQEAFDLAMKYQRIYREVPHDVTAAAIAGGCALVAFRANGWMQGSLGDFIQRNDNPAAWWRSQILSYGLSAHLEESFGSWANSSSSRGVDQAHRRLRSAALLASCAADQNGWRSAQGQLAQHLLVSSRRESKPGEVAAQLTALRLAGDSKALGLAIRRVVSEGPCEAVQIASSNVVPAYSTRTTALADLEFFIRAGDVVPSGQADQVCSWVLATLNESENYCSRTRPAFAVEYKLFDVLGALVWAMSEQCLQDVTDYLLAMPAVADDAKAQYIAPLVRKIPDAAWTDEKRHLAGLRAQDDARYLCEAYLGIAMPHVEESREVILDRARSGDLLVFEAINDIRTLPADVVTVLAVRTEEVIITLLRDAQRGTYGFGGLDPAHALTLINIWHTEHSRWPQIKELLSSKAAAPAQKKGVLEVLARHGAMISGQLKEELLPLVESLKSSTPGNGLSFDQVDIRGLAAEAAAALSNHKKRKRILSELLAGDDLQRASAARVMERFSEASFIELLIALSGDTSSTVRNAAAGALSQMAAAGEAPENVIELLARLLASSGRDLAVVIVSRLVSQSTSNGGNKELLELAQQHPAARVRREATV